MLLLQLFNDSLAWVLVWSSLGDFPELYLLIHLLLNTVWKFSNFYLCKCDRSGSVKPIQLYACAFWCKWCLLWPYCWQHIDLPVPLNSRSILPVHFTARCTHTQCVHNDLDIWSGRFPENELQHFIKLVFVIFVDIIGERVAPSSF